MDSWPLEKDNPGSIIFTNGKYLADVQRNDIEWKDKIQYVIGPPDGAMMKAVNQRAAENEESNENE
jgi:hypothetical protein